MEIHHIGIAVEDLEQAARPYLGLGYALEASGTVESQGVEVWMLRSGGSRLELLKATRPDSAIARFIEKRGPGLHHIALATPNIQAELKRLAAEGTPLIDTTPRPGFGGHRVAFIHPKWSGGVLVELVEAHT
ncbi:methylmalonyl-CoA epimerase [Meiothermus taiwanensis]|jgi:methylmalonyl-CoA/ethylmalonyl-CoA epimerase|uniref:Methylmalonyl-CoA epimerase n=2 Tax=Meiothermus taiwanensis TaxID=172827 RepID=A0A399DXQ1_9DEIN|nr:methylmalonyl-CoA epimerase [Meiothermus taiwanensis]AWR87206.1 methylmalonyl-CoA epimerase [Meiothermus taiwanensis WR-220]KIQ55504.1 methylmalonyl-CoA epimerase [Meiothermus taiwanensis]MCX7803325.1 methylmalonyl-CoA epimerase [Meiothermus ruber]RIH76143.1 methylmalonyl-CoA epimerase [Meiothermus taiwanensis]